MMVPFFMFGQFLHLTFLWEKEKYIFTELGSTYYCNAIKQVEISNIDEISICFGDFSAKETLCFQN